MRCLKPLSLKGMLVPCGQCVACRVNFNRQWAIRITHESRCWPENCFLTLTYDEEHLPAGKTLVKRDIQLFIKSLRKAVKGPVRYYLAGEYGSKNGRPHYHLALFNIGTHSECFKNRRFDGKRKGYWCTIDFWDKGQCFVGSLTEDSARYISGYIMKKVKGKHSHSHYVNLGIEPEFSLMSRRPGIGSLWLDKHVDFVREHDFVYFKQKKANLPRFYRLKVFTEEEREALSRKRAEELQQKAVYDDPVLREDRRKQAGLNLYANKRRSDLE